MRTPSDGAPLPVPLHPGEVAVDERDPEAPFVTVGHEHLFERPALRCDACSAELDPAGGDGDGYAVPGEGAYLWTRGDDVRVELAPLCAPCSAAIGLAAMARWEIEEEEG